MENDDKNKVIPLQLVLPFLCVGELCDFAAVNKACRQAAYESYRYRLNTPLPGMKQTIRNETRTLSTAPPTVRMFHYSEAPDGYKIPWWWRGGVRRSLDSPSPDEWDSNLFEPHRWERWFFIVLRPTDDSWRLAYKGLFLRPQRYMSPSWHPDRDRILALLEERRLFLPPHLTRLVQRQERFGQVLSRNVYPTHCSYTNGIFVLVLIVKTSSMTETQEENLSAARSPFVGLGCFS